MAKLPGAVQGARIVGQQFVRSQRQHNPEGRMPLMDHLRELRNRVVKIALGLLPHERFRTWRRVLLFGVFLIAGMANPSGTASVAGGKAPFDAEAT